MNKWIRWQGIGAFAVVLLVWFLLVDTLVKAAIENFGSSAVGAKVELASADLSLAPLGITLEQLVVTNPERPMENIVEAGLIELELDAANLLRRKIIADTMQINNLRFNTPRKSSGALATTKAEEQAQQKEMPFTLPGVSLPNTDKLVEEQKAGLQKEVDSIQQNITAIKTKWQKKQDELPSKADVDNYKKRFKAAKAEKNQLKKIKALNDLRDDIKKDLRAFKGLNKELDSDINSLKQEIRRAKNLPTKQADQLLADLGLNTSSSEITAMLMSGKLDQWVDQVKAMIGTSANLSGDKASTPARGEGQWILFDEYNPLPNLLIKTTQISGILDAAGESLSFTGEIKNITDQPKILGEPTTIKLTGSSSAGGSIIIDGLTDRTTELATDKLTIDVSELALNNFSLSDRPELSLLLNQGQANSNITVYLIDGRLDANATSLFKQLNLTATSIENNKTSEIIKSVLNSVNEFNLDISATGTLDEPSLSITSDLDKLLKEGLGQQLNQEKAKLKSSIQAELQDSLNTKLGPLEEQLGGINAIKQEINKKKDELDAIRR